jgi:hypothetical protein
MPYFARFHSPWSMIADLRCREIICATPGRLSARMGNPRVSSSMTGKRAVSELQQNISGCNSTARASAVVPERGIPPSKMSIVVIRSTVSFRGTDTGFSECRRRRGDLPVVTISRSIIVSQLSQCVAANPMFVRRFFEYVPHAAYDPPFFFVSLLVFR